MAKQTKAVFLYGKPTMCKMVSLWETQELYTEHINFFIEKLVSDKTYYLDILNNNKKSQKVRLLEKENRTRLGSAYGQNAIDHAVKELHNHFTRIKNYLYGVTMDKDENYFVSSIALLNLSILGLTYKETRDIVEGLIETIQGKPKQTKADQEKLLFYGDIMEMLNSKAEQEVECMMGYISSLFFMELQSRKIPYLKNIQLQLDSRLCTIEDAENVKADYVLSVKTLEKKRVEIPITTSQKSLRRLKQYGMKSPSIKITPKGIRVTVPFEKNVTKKSKSKNLVGVDIGITDLLYDSEGNSFGEYSKVVQFYNEKVLSEDVKLNNLRNLMKRHQRELRSKSTHLERKEFLRKKIRNLNTMLQSNKKANRIRRSYKQKQVEEVSRVIKGYLNTIKGKGITTVIEDLDITTFDRGKENNRRDSLWARGLLHRKLEEKLVWEGYEVLKVDPAYTSKACPICHNIHNDNRKYKEFECSSCGHKADADHNASVNIKNRANDQEVKSIVEKYTYNIKKRHTALKELYAKRHEEYKKTVA